MLGLGWSEMLVIAMVALIVVGPRELPAALRHLGRVVGTIRRMGNEFRAEFNKMVALEEVRDVRKSLTDPLRNAQRDIEREFNRTASSGVKPGGASQPDAGAQGAIGAVRTQSGASDVSTEATNESSDGESAAKPAAKARPGRKFRSGTAAGSKTVAKSKTAAASGSRAAKKQTSAKAAATEAGKVKAPAKPTRAPAKPSRRRTAAKAEKT